jgi:flagellar biosynthesis protein FlhF
MQIKKYSGQTLKEATAKMKEELGNQAIILGSKMIAADLKAGKRKMFEITVGYDNPVKNEKRIETQRNNETGTKKNYSEEIATLTEKVYARENNSLVRKNNTSAKPVQKKPVNREAVKTEIDRELKEIADVLEHREVQKNIISLIIHQLKEYAKYLHSTNIDNYVLSSIESMIPTKNFELNKNKGTKVVAVVGPTGVGKTTCIAKLAVIAKILHNLDVGLISIDTYRLGAIDQLRIFSEVSNIDMLVAYEPEEIPELMKSLKGKDIIFIDTAGRNQKRKDQLNRINEYLSEIKIDETFLVMSSTNSTKNLFDIAEKFKVFNYDSFIFTKVDEGIAFGNILNVVTSFNTPVTFLSNGQIIPDDIMSADSEFISKLIYTGKVEK